MSLFKASQEEAEKTPEPSKRVPPPHAKPAMSAYPDFTKSLVSQRRKSPGAAGIERAGKTGVTGAVLGALVARIVTDNPVAVAGGAVAGGVAGAVPGFISGKREAESDYGRLLFLRRRADINDPGELETLLQNPALLQTMSRRSKTAAVKKAFSLTQLHPALKAVLAAGAAGGGYVAGTKGTAKLMGYSDDPAATHVGGYVNAANAGAAMLAVMSKNPAHLKALLHPGALGAMAGMEVIPAGLRSVNRMADASKAQAEKQTVPALQTLAKSNVGKGMGAGVGIAGLGALLTGLLRAKTDEEIRKNKSRAGMVGSDFLKYVVPAAAGGGVIGSMAK